MEYVRSVFSTRRAYISYKSFRSPRYIVHVFTSRGKASLVLSYRASRVSPMLLQSYHNIIPAFQSCIIFFLSSSRSVLVYYNPDLTSLWYVRERTKWFLTKPQAVDVYFSRGHTRRYDDGARLSKPRALARSLVRTLYGATFFSIASEVKAASLVRNFPLFSPALKNLHLNVHLT